LKTVERLYRILFQSFDSEFVSVLNCSRSCYFSYKFLSRVNVYGREERGKRKDEIFVFVFISFFSKKKL
jgi:hypothetical protein